MNESTSMKDVCSVGGLCSVWAVLDDLCRMWVVLGWMGDEQLFIAAIISVG